jgi:N-acetylglucosaminyldiphosphoundecaprenol N-acetyl-beta-D-mannosaminyltransferase
MEKKYFKVRIEFDQDRYDQIIEDAVKNDIPGYVCAIEANNLSYAYHHADFLNVVNGALVNSCDGAVLAKILARIHHEDIDCYPGTDIFDKYTALGKYRQFFLGNTPEVLASLKENLTAKRDPKIADMRFETLPFRKVEEFDYQGIADMINADNPDVIWVSLGAPKQEYFMARLKPYLKRGVLFGVGAAFNFNSSVGNVKRSPEWMHKMRLLWLHRACEEPKKNIPRYWRFIKTLPTMIWNEKKMLRAESQSA